MAAIRILIVDDLKMICNGLKEMFASESEFEVVGFAHDGKEAIAKIIQTKPDVVLIDVLMPVMGGIEATKEISRRFSSINVIVISSFQDEPIIAQAISVGAKGYLLKNMRAEDLALAIRSVHLGASHFAPGLKLNSAISHNDSQTTTTATATNGDSKTINHNNTTTIEVDIEPKQNNKNQKKVKKVPTQKPLFLYGDWIAVVFGIVIFSRIDGMGHHLAHAGLFLLMLSLIARPIRFWWDIPLKYRRTIGILAFAAATAHAIYATINVLNGRAGTVLAMTTQSQIGIVAGIISLVIMTPAAVTSFRYFQRKLGKKWKQIHLLTVPALVLAVLHTIIIGPHYLSQVRLETIDQFRVYTVAFLGLLTIGMRRQFFWSILGLNKLGRKKAKKS